MDTQFYTKLINRCQTIDGLASDLEELLEVMDTIREADKRENWVLSYLRDGTTTLELLANKRDFIVNLMRQQIAAAFKDDDPNDIEVELALRLSEQ